MNAYIKECKKYNRIARLEKLAAKRRPNLYIARNKFRYINHNKAIDIDQDYCPYIISA